MGWRKEEPMWYTDGRPSNEAAREYGDPPWLGCPNFQQEEADRQARRNSPKEVERRAEERRREIEHKRRPKPKKPGGYATADTRIEFADGSLSHVICECECGGGLVIRYTGQEIFCHFCGSTWVAEIDRELGGVSLRSDATTVLFSAGMFRVMRLEDGDE